MSHLRNTLLVARHRGTGFTLVETMLAMLGGMIIIGGVYVMLQRSAGRYAEEMTTANSAEQGKRIASLLNDEWRQLITSTSNSQFGILIGENGASTLQTTLPNPSNATQVSPDRVTFISPVQTNGEWLLANEVSPSSFDSKGFIVPVAYSDGLPPEFETGDLLMMRTGKAFILGTVVGKEDQATYVDYTLELYAGELLTDDGKVSGAYYTEGGFVTYDDAIEGFPTFYVDGTRVNAVRVVQYFAVPATGNRGINIYRATNSNDANNLQLVANAKGLFDFQLRYRLADGSIVDEVVNFADSRNVAAIQLELQAFASKNRDVSARTEVALRDKIGKELDSSFGGIGASPSEKYGDYIAGPSIAIYAPYVDPSGKAAPATNLFFRSLFHPTNNTGKIKVFNDEGETLTEINTNRPVIGLVQDPVPASGEIYALLARGCQDDGDSSDGDLCDGSWKAEGLVIPKDNDGRIDLRATAIGTKSFTGVNSVSAMIFRETILPFNLNAVTGVPAHSTETLYYEVMQGFGPDNAPNGYNDDTTITMYWRTRTPLQDRYTTEFTPMDLGFGNITLPVDMPAGVSNLVNGAADFPAWISSSAYDPAALGAQLFSTSPAIDPVTNTPQQGGLFMLATFSSLGVPQFTYSPTGFPEYGYANFITPKPIFYYDTKAPGGQIYSYSMGTGKETDYDKLVNYGIAAFTNAYGMTRNQVVSAAVRRQLSTSDPRYLPPQTISLGEDAGSGQVYCKNTLSGSSLASSYTGGSSFTYEAPMLVSMASTSEPGIVRVAASLPTQGRDLLFSVNNRNFTRAALTASIVPNKAASSRALVRLFNNAPSAFDAPTEATRNFLYSVIPNDGLNTPCTPTLPKRANHANLKDVSDVQQLLGKKPEEGELTVDVETGSYKFTASDSGGGDTDGGGGMVDGGDEGSGDGGGK